MSASKLDAVYRSILITKFFSKGWGKPENLRRLFEFRKIVSNRDECFKLVERDYPVTITKDEVSADCRIVEGHFVSPLERYLPGIVPEVAQKAHFQALFPLHWKDNSCKPICLHLAGTGDHFYWRRRNLMVKPLLKDAGIGGIILENPFYGLRKPLDQIRSSLHNVSDIFVMGGCLILESLVMFHWCERNGLGPLGVTGLSMGGHMASLAATNWPKPLVLVPCLSWSTASAVFLQGVMAHSINWDLLEDQYLSDGNYREKLFKMVTVVDEAFLAGKKFAQKFSKTVDNTNNIVKTSTVAQSNNNTTKETASNNSKLNNATSEKGNSQKAENLESSATNVVKETVINDNVKEDRQGSECNEKMLEDVILTFDSAETKRIHAQLKRLREECKISRNLYMKLTSETKFELVPSDVDELNRLTEKKILVRVAKKYKIGLTTGSKSECLKAVTVLKEEMVKAKLENDSPSTPADGKTEDSKIDVTHQQHIDVPFPPVGPQVAYESSNYKNTTSSQPQEKKSRNITEMTSEILSSLPFIRNKSESRKIDISKIHWRDREALQFMRGIMDECTHLSNFSVPFDTSLIIAVCAKHDAYVPREDVGTLEEIWPGAEVRYVDAGHVSAYLLHQSLFRSCIIEAFERSKKQWKDNKRV